MIHIRQLASAHLPLKTCLSAHGFITRTRRFRRKKGTCMRSSFFHAVTITGMLWMASFCQGSSSIRPAKPTHYFYTPTAYLNNEFELVASFHEISYALPHDLQFHASLFDNVGRICFGARYGIHDNLSIGGGLAWSLYSLPNRGHGIIHNDDHPRFGGFLCWGITKDSRFECALTPHFQLGYHFSMGCDYGMMITPSKWWSIIGEFGFSFDLNDSEPYFNTIWGARVHPPEVIPFLSFDAGIDFVESRPEDFAERFAPFFDVIFSMKTAR